jgi:hypothetical protein
MDSKIGKLQIILPNGETLDSDNVRLEPVEPRYWPYVASYAEALRRLASDELVAIILRYETGDYDINVEQCLAVLDECRLSGIQPDENLVSRLYGAFLETIEKAVAARHSRCGEPN